MPWRVDAVLTVKTAKVENMALNLHQLTNRHKIFTVYCTFIIAFEYK